VAAWIRARAKGKDFLGVPRRVEVTPSPLKVQFLEQYATKGDLRDLDERWERRLTQTFGEIRADIIGMRRDLKELNDAAEARWATAAELANEPTTPGLAALIAELLSRRDSGTLNQSLLLTDMPK